MSFDSLIGNMLHPPVLFFFLGIIAVLVKSDLEVPPAIAKFLSIYLLFDIGIKGGEELYHSGFSSEVLLVMGACVAISFMVPWGVFPILRRKLNIPDAGAIAATYGSISAVIFTSGVSFLESEHIAFSGFMVASMALMESPAIVSGLILIRKSSEKKVHRDLVVVPADAAVAGGWGAPGTPQPEPQPVAEKPKHSMLSVLHEAFFNGSVLLLVGSLLIGYISGTEGEKELKPFVGDIFKGMLSLYMLDMGLLAGKRLGELKQNGPFLAIFALGYPVVMGAVGIGLSYLMGLSPGDALLFALLCSSSSFIAVPAAMRMAVPEANMSLLLPMSLGITNTFLIIFGIPIINQTIQALW